MATDVLKTASDALAAKEALDQNNPENRQQVNAFGTINQFKSHMFNYGVARPNMFLAIITAPVSNTQYAQATSLLCKNADFPPMTLEVRERLTYGVGINLPYARSHQPVNLEFYVDNLYSSKVFFDDWMSFITDYNLQDPTQSTHDVEFFCNYAGTVTLYQTHIGAPDSEDDCVYAIQLNECYPQAVVMSGFAHDAMDSQHTLRVTLNYTSMQVLKINTNQIVSNLDPARKQMYDAAGLNNVKFDQKTLSDDVAKYSNTVNNLFNTNISSGIGSYVNDVPVSQFNSVTSYFKG